MLPRSALYHLRSGRLTICAMRASFSWISMESQLWTRTWLRARAEGAGSTHTTPPVSTLILPISSAQSPNPRCFVRLSSTAASSAHPDALIDTLRFAGVA